MIKGLPREAEPNEIVSLDVEMFGMSKPHRADGTFACLSIAFLDGDVYQLYDAKAIPEALARLDNGMWTMQNALFDLRVLRRYAEVPQRFVWDTMLVEMDLFGGWYSRFSLKNLARRWLGVMLPKEIRDRFEKAVEMTPEMEEYAVQDAIVTAQIAKKQIDYIYKEYDGQMPWYMDIDEPAIWAVLDMQPARVDVEAWNENARRLQEDAMQAQEELGYNVNSHKIVKKKIEAALGRGIKSTNANKVLIPLLGKLNKENPAAVLIREVIKIRKMRKAAETYGKTWTEQHS